MDSLHTRAQNDSPGANASSVKSDDSSPCHDPGRGSPPPKCAICLGTCRNKSFTDSCLHQFCFKCLLTWSKVKAECPLCKQNFRSIIHNVRSNHQYEEYMVEQRHTEEISERIDIDSLTTAARRFRYRTTLTLPRQDSIAIQQLLLQHYPMVAELFPSPPAPRRRSPASFRRTVYRYNLWARPLPDFTRRFRDCSPEFYRHNTSQMHRLVPWLNRELHYLLNENVGHISYVVSRILELLPQYSIVSPEFREAMHRYFGDNTDHFLHELYCFASTPYDMNGYDRNVQYTTDNTISTMVNEVLSSSESEASVDSDIVMISSSAPADPPPGPSRAPAPVYPQSYIQPTPGIIPIETISQSDTDDDSSEVMVVGYIKPPQDRTPEVVDLLGSDSDVIVQDCTLPEPRDATDAAQRRPSSLVKLTLKRHDAGAAPDSDSDASFYTPSPSPPRLPRRRRRYRSDDTATTADTRRTTPSPASSLTTTASDSIFSGTDTDSSDYFMRNPSERVKRKKARRKLTTSERNKSKTRKRPSRAQRKSKKDSNASPGKDRQNKHKSLEGKGVKSSKKYTAADGASTAEPVRAHAAPGPPDTSETGTEWTRAPDPPGANGSVVDDMKLEPDQPGTSGASSERKRALEEPGTSGVIKKHAPEQSVTNGVVNDRKRNMERSSRRRKVSRETKRLKSVVNVINSMNNAEPSKQSDGDRSGENQGAAGYRSDSSDDLPLNLSVKKGSRQ